MSVPADSSVLVENDLQQQLDAKDQLVRALTDRLEEAAEQLDRVHRTGADKGARTAGSGSDSHVSNVSLLEKLSKSFELWEDVQPGDAFARIEERLDELRDMLEGAVVRGSGESKAPKKSDTLAGWEKMKAELMEAELKELDQKTSASAKNQNAAPSPATACSQPVDSPTPAPLAPLPPREPQRPLAQMQLPEPIELETAPRAELEEAIETRDQYIGELTRRLRAAESRTYQQIDWAALNNAPEELRATLQTLESELDDRLRIAEVDLSLERARLSRVETRIRGMQVQIEKRLQQSAGNDSLDEQRAEKKNASLSKSWFGSLGRS